ncbi:hypothetical protein CALCODRAFT_515916 [Calocera cornea HHB12733]|uniref:JmjC domain-containing protein n=1 Tax=Calocera cornea HHB12733 TaxID=1353952 RepID=A0A165HW64_9BASI|nr:hypothetical protein CALCODRAFT_515916 [Calocera cornea HHB12733]
MEAVVEELSAAVGSLIVPFAAAAASASAAAAAPKPKGQLLPTWGADQTVARRLSWYNDEELGWGGETVEHADTESDPLEDIPPMSYTTFLPVDNRPEYLTLPMGRLSPKMLLNIEKHKNSWLSSAFSEWMEVAHMSSIAAQLGCKILKAAMCQAATIRPFPTFPVEDFVKSSGTYPTEYRALVDFLAAPNDEDVKVTVLDNGMTGLEMPKAKVLQSWIHHSVGGYNVKSHVPSFGIFDIFGTPEGMGGVVFGVPNAVLGTSTEIYPPLAEVLASTTLQPMGSVTAPHIDVIFAHVAQIAVKQELDGAPDKLWLIAPPTEKNLELLAETLDGIANPDLSARIVASLEQLHWVRQTPGVCFIVPAGWIHCVLTFQWSLHVGFKFVCAEHQEDARRYIMWCIKKLSAIGNLTTGKEMLRVIELDLKLWGNVRSAEKWVKEAKDALADVKESGKGRRHVK